MRNRDNDIEFILRQDSREKKQAGIGVFKRASRLGYCRGGIKTQSDFLTAKERKKLSGEVRVYNMYADLNNLPSLKELKEIIKKDPAKAKLILTEAKANNTQGQLKAKLGCSSGWLYYAYDKVGVEYEKGKAIGYRKTAQKSAGKPVIKEKKDKTRRTLPEMLAEAKITEEDLNYVRKINNLPKNYQMFKFEHNFSSRLKELVEIYSVIELAIILNCTDKQLTGVAYRLGYKLKRSSVITSKLLNDIEEFRKIIKKEKPVEKLVEVEEVQEELDIAVNEPTIASKEVYSEVDLSPIETKLELLGGIVSGLMDRVENMGKEKEVTTGFQIKLNGIYDKTNIENKLLAIAGILADDKNYEIDVVLKEV